jgi:hypothetical protein
VNEWLVSGVYDALKRQYVQKIQLSIGAAHDPSTFFEEYTFSVTYYNGAPQVDLELHGNATSSSPSPTPAPVRVTLSRQEQYNSVTRMLRSMVTLLTPLPDLINDDKRVSVRLHYAHDTPVDYEPPGFRALLASNPDDMRIVPQHGVLSDYDVMEFGALHTQHHSLALSFTSLAASELDDDSSLLAEPARVAPVDVEQDNNNNNNDATPADEDIVVDDNISCEPFASATPLEVDENECEPQYASSGVAVAATPTPPPLRAVLTQLTHEQVQQRRIKSATAMTLPPLEKALSQVASPDAASSIKSAANRDREELLKLRDAALHLLSRARVGEIMTTARIQQYVVADSTLASKLLRRFEQDGLVARNPGRGFYVTTKGVNAHARMQKIK